MTQYAFYFDSTRCTGCRTCEMACKDYKDSSEGIHFRKVYDYEGGTNVVDVYVGYLRKKVDAGAEKKLIHTVWGTGWVLKEA